jgi:hypothetical protein
MPIPFQKILENRSSNIVEESLNITDVRLIDGGSVDLSRNR